MEKHLSKTRTTGSLPLDITSILMGRAVVAIGDTVVAAVDGIAAARDSLYYSRHRQGNLVLPKAVMAGITTAVRSNYRYFKDSQNRMYRELTEILE